NSMGFSSPGHIGLDTKMISEGLNRTMLHELQHQVQGLEGFAKGGSPQSSQTSLINALLDTGMSQSEVNSLIAKMSKGGIQGWQLYKNLAGEVEARNAANRFHTGPVYRRATPPWMDEDVP